MLGCVASAGHGRAVQHRHSDAARAPQGCGEGVPRRPRVDPDARGAAASRQTAARHEPRDQAERCSPSRREGHDGPASATWPVSSWAGPPSATDAPGCDPLVPACPRGLARQQAARLGLAHALEKSSGPAPPASRRRAPRSDPAAGRRAGPLVPVPHRPPAGWRRPPSTASGTPLGPRPASSRATLLAAASAQAPPVFRAESASSGSRSW